MMQETELTEVAVEPPVALKDIEEDIEDEDTKRKRERDKSIKTKIVQGVAAGSLAVNIGAMAIVGTGVTIAMGVVACVVAPVVIKRQMDLEDTDSKC